jgi:polysaccharide export outer membrane protein
MHPTIKYPNLFFVLLAVLLTAASCTASKKVVYLNDLTPADSIALRTAQIAFETPIQKNDQLSIMVGGSNAADLLIINSASGVMGAGGSSGGGANNPIIGYLVEADGKIKIPYIGKIQAEGLTRLQLENILTEQFKEYTKNPVVNVRFLNYNFSVLGEVNKPGRLSMTTERVSILEAISMAGDITYLGKSDNVLIVREENGKRSFERVNLLSKDLFKSPFFYLKTNDVIYIEPVRAKFISRAGVPQYLSIVAVGLSLILTIINLKK